MASLMVQKQLVPSSLGSYPLNTSLPQRPILRDAGAIQITNGTDETLSPRLASDWTLGLAGAEKVIQRKTGKSHWN
jgi:hypothetical protein